MKLNNKGITLVEIIISVALISIVLIFLFSLLIQVNNENADNEVRSSYLVNQSTFIKQIEEDFLDYKFSTGGSCDYDNINTPDKNETDDTYLYLPNLSPSTASESNIKCLTFKFEDIENKGCKYAYLFLYKRLDNKVYLSYYRCDFRQSVELEDFDWTANSGHDASVKTSSSNGVNNIVFSLPIIGPDSNDYSINLSYARE